MRGHEGERHFQFFITINRQKPRLIVKLIAISELIAISLTINRKLIAISELIAISLTINRGRRLIVKTSISSTNRGAINRAAKTPTNRH